MVALVFSSACDARDGTAAAGAGTAPTGDAPGYSWFSFRASEVELSIVDTGFGKDLPAVREASGAELVVNGGFFDARSEAVGLAVSRRVTLSRFDPTLSGGVLWKKGGTFHLTATEAYVHASPDFAIQCRPRLVVGSLVNIRSDDGQRARRTAICLKESAATLVFLVVAEPAEPPTLRELARVLVDAGCEEALNLDGGPSTGFATPSAAIAPEGPVRHAVAVRRSP